MNGRAAKSPCQACPWRVENHGKRHPDGWYTKANLRRLWSGIRRGEEMSCHPTDPSNPVSERAQEKGYRAAPEHAQVRECAGAVILAQREMQVASDLADAQPDADLGALYAQHRPGGMTREGLLSWFARLVTWPGDVPMRRDHNLHEPVATADPRLEWPVTVRADR